MSAPTWALTVPQPAAWAIAHGHQDVYNRTMPTGQRGWIAICAGADLDHKTLNRTAQLTGRTLEAIISACPERHMVIAVARLTDVCEGGSCDCGPWADRQLIHWRLADATPLAEPVPAPRTVGLWQMSDELAARVATQWERAQGFAPEAEPAVPQDAKDSLTLRNELLPLPGTAEGYRHVLLLGTTGAGKTTVVRQLLGTDPKTERFPSTSAAKTTVADTELILTGRIAALYALAAEKSSISPEQLRSAEAFITYVISSVEHIMAAGTGPARRKAQPAAADPQITRKVIESLLAAYPAPVSRSDLLSKIKNIGSTAALENSLASLGDDLHTSVSHTGGRPTRLYRLTEASVARLTQNTGRSASDAIDHYPNVT